MKCCESCQECCCEDNNIDLTPRELKFFKKNTPDLEYTTYGDMGRVRVHPCPFLINKRCSVYSQRPLICATFPLSLKIDETEVTIFWDIRCPKMPPVNLGSKMGKDQMLELLGASAKELARMLVASVISHAELKREYITMPLKDKNRLRVWGLKLKQTEKTLAYTWGMLKIPSRMFNMQVNSSIDLLNAGKSYEKIFDIVVPLLELAIHGKEPPQESIQTHMMITGVGWKVYLEKVKALIDQDPDMKDWILSTLTQCIPEIVSSREFNAIANYLAGGKGSVQSPQLLQTQRDVDFLINHPFTRLPDE